MLNDRETFHTLLWDPTEPVATRPLAITKDNRTSCYGWDFNKNVTELFDEQGSLATSYDYSPYGELLSEPSPGIGEENPYRFSSEYDDDELGLVYYNYRHYNPADGRWISRDPVTEQGGRNLYEFVGNNSAFSIDRLGLIKTGDPCAECCKGCKKEGKKVSIKDIGSQNFNIKISVTSPTFTEECKNEGECYEYCCYVSYSWSSCYTGRCMDQTTKTFDKTIVSDPSASVWTALGVSVNGYFWCSCEDSKWKCYKNIERTDMSNIILYSVDSQIKPTKWNLVKPTKTK